MNFDCVTNNSKYTNIFLIHFCYTYIFTVFPGENDIDQLGIVIRALGTPNEDIWPGVKGTQNI